VVDNGSTDQTRAVIQSYKSVLPLVYVFESALGKNVALNAGLASISGDLVVLTDDDVFPRPDWLIQLRKAADRNSSFSIFGGVILPRWEVPPSSWVAHIPPAPAFTITSPSLREGPIDPEYVFGPNMAIRADIFNKGIRFDPNIGPKGSDYPMSGETELLLRLKEQGHKAWHARRAVVEHFIRKEQIAKRWVFQRAVRFGRGQQRLGERSPASKKVTVFGVPPQYFLRILKRLVVIAIAFLKSDEAKMAVAQWELNILWGHVVEARMLRRRTDSAATSKEA
jgi:glycosyltransferase involved in cell wall biosynthesis